jgi:hypothetical protein
VELIKASGSKRINIDRSTNENERPIQKTKIKPHRVTLQEKWEDSELTISQCFDCKWRIMGTIACHAFPDGMPMEILSNEVRHDTPRPYQENDLVYEKIESWPEEG